MTRDELAKAIFDWLNRSESEEANGAPPYTFNDDAVDLTIGVDGRLDCKRMADGILRNLGAVEVRPDPKRRIKGVRTQPSN